MMPVGIDGINWIRPIFFDRNIGRVFKLHQLFSRNKIIGIKYEGYEVWWELV